MGVADAHAAQRGNVISFHRGRVIRHFLVALTVGDAKDMAGAVGGVVVVTV
jgi:hypothetical protein